MRGTTLSNGQPRTEGAVVFDEWAARCAGIPTRENPRTCEDCENVSAGRTCLAAQRSDLDCVQNCYALDLTRPRYCLAYRPRYGSYERRTGPELWPEIAAVADLEQSGEVQNLAIAFVTGFLRETPRLASDVIAAGRAAGLNSRAVQRATVLLGIVKTRAEFQGRWMWRMREKCY
jgi:hypothetical protein